MRMRAEPKKRTTIKLLGSKEILKMCHMFPIPCLYVPVNRSDLSRKASSKSRASIGGGGGVTEPSGIR